MAAGAFGRARNYGRDGPAAGAVDHLHNSNINELLCEVVLLQNYYSKSSQSKTFNGLVHQILMFSCTIKGLLPGGLRTREGGAVGGGGGGGGG